MSYNWTSFQRRLRKLSHITILLWSNHHKHRFIGRKRTGLSLTQIARILKNAGLLARDRLHKKKYHWKSSGVTGTYQMNVDSSNLQPNVFSNLPQLSPNSLRATWAFVPPRRQRGPHRCVLRFWKLGTSRRSFHWQRPGSTFGNTEQQEVGWIRS